MLRDHDIFEPLAHQKMDTSHVLESKLASEDDYKIIRGTIAHPIMVLVIACESGIKAFLLPTGEDIVQPPAAHTVDTQNVSKTEANLVGKVVWK